jgi:hypothetical protein
MVEFFSYRSGAESAEGVVYVYDYVYESWGWKEGDEGIVNVNVNRIFEVR